MKACWLRNLGTDDVRQVRLIQISDWIRKLEEPQGAYWLLGEKSIQTYLGDGLNLEEVLASEIWNPEDNLLHAETMNHIFENATETESESLLAFLNGDMEINEIEPIIRSVRERMLRERERETTNG